MPNLVLLSTSEVFCQLFAPLMCFIQVLCPMVYFLFSQLLLFFIILSMCEVIISLEISLDICLLISSCNFFEHLVRKCGCLPRDSDTHCFVDLEIALFFFSCDLSSLYFELLVRECGCLLLDFSLTVKAAPHACLIRTGQP